VYLEIFVDTPLEECKQRDTKGVYAQPLVPGVGVEYERPTTPDAHVEIDGAGAATAIAAMIASRHEAR
jgi:bifunctional enzyme CysN/CysC